MTHRRWITRLAILAGLAALVLLLKATVLAPDAVPVRVVAVGRGLVEETVTNSRAGTVKARLRAKLSPEIGGRVVSLPFAKGDRVKRGDLLLRVDDSIQRASLQLAERELAAARAQREQACLSAELAERERARAAQLAEEGILSADRLDRASSQAETTRAACEAADAVAARAEAAVVLARAQLAQTELRAPFDGLLAERAIEVGEWTTPSPPALPVPTVIDLIDTGSIYLSAPMDEVDSARIRAGARARLTIDSRPGRSFSGSVTRVASFVEDRLDQNRTVEIEAELDDQDTAAVLLPGTSADAEVILSTREDVLRIPTSALFEDRHVLVFSDGQLTQREVEVGLRNWDFAEILVGLREGERVVAALDRPEIKAGARARIEEDRPAS